MAEAIGKATEHDGGGGGRREEGREEPLREKGDERERETHKFIYKFICLFILFLLIDRLGNVSCTWIRCAGHAPSRGGAARCPSPVR